MEKKETLISAPEVGRRLGISRGLVARMASRGELPAVRVGPKLWRFDWEEVLRSLGVKRATA